MARTIKFRGRDMNGKVYFGGLFQNSFGECYIIVDLMNIVKVVPESVAQFIGLDKQGNEIYERDILVTGRSTKDFVAALRHTDTVHVYTLKARASW